MSPQNEHSIDWTALRERYASAGGQEYWRGIDELAESPEFRQMLEREFPDGASEWWDGVSRRDFLKLAAASLALAGLSACTQQPAQTILPYVHQPTGLVPGEPLFYATSMLVGGFATGVLAKSREGHPIKVDGNPNHPSALGGSSVWMQASILDLYDPDRSQAVAHRGEISSWASFLGEMGALSAAHSANGGKGLRFLTETVTSPTMAGLFEEAFRKFPDSRWCRFDPISRDNVREGARMAFGEVVEAHYHFEHAEVILSIESDFLCAHPERLRYTRRFAESRRGSAGQQRMSRLYVLESSPTITGSMADWRVPIESGRAGGFLHEVAERLAGGKTAGSFGDSGDLLKAVMADLDAHRGRGIIIAGESQPPPVHALAHALNDRLGNVGTAVTYSELAEATAPAHSESLSELAAELQRGEVQTLLILGGNPVYTAPADLEFAGLVKKAGRAIHLSSHLDETSILCDWHVPQSHYLESWGDARSLDGTVSFMQPLIAPLYGGRTACEVLGALIAGLPAQTDYDLLRRHWRAKGLGPDFETGWRRAVHDGFVSGTAAPRKNPRVKPAPARFALPAKAEALEICFRPDANVWDGSFANNGWLQECPRPLSKLVWDNAALISPALAGRLRIQTGDMLELACQGRQLRAPALVMPGQAGNSVTLHLGYGRTRAGRVGSGVGFNAFALRTSEALWGGPDLQLRATGERHSLVTTQTHQSLHSPGRQIYREATLAELLRRPGLVRESAERPAEDHTLYNTGEFPSTGYKWGMSIDLGACVGCNACVVACEAENNIPVVGKGEVARNREMFWIRVDTYLKGSPDAPQFSHMPVPCMHCEHAPCELVCPVAAAVHDHEGLNLQIYNRCVGTRFCSNNCPYKVRRFNFFQYARYSAPNLKPMYNPEVTVRWRGVMEKCTYCVQRISAARIHAEKENRKIGDQEIRTACQQACPADAIIFGDLNDPESRLSKLKRSPLDYSMLGQLNTRPRTTYLARVRNPPGAAPPENP